MHFLNEMFHRVAQAGEKKPGRKYDLVKRMTRFLPTTEPAESANYPGRASFSGCEGGQGGSGRFQKH